jgi:enoyl reductase-like protein
MNPDKMTVEELLNKAVELTEDIQRDLCSLQHESARRLTEQLLARVMAR